MPPPPGKETNLVDPEYSGTKLLATTCVLLPIAMITLAIRIWTRLFIVRSFRLDDCEIRLRFSCFHWLTEIFI